MESKGLKGQYLYNKFKWEQSKTLLEEIDEIKLMRLKQGKEEVCQWNSTIMEMNFA